MKARADDIAGLSKYRKYTYAWLLTADDNGRVKLGAKGLEHDGNAEIELADLAAKVLWEYDKGIRRLDPDTAAWLARALGATHSKRYLALLKELAATNPGKIAKYAASSLTALSKSGETFDPEVVQLDQIRSSLRADAQDELPGDGSLFDFQSGVWIEDVFAKLGYPTDVGMAVRTRKVPHIGRISVTNLLLGYAGKGSIEFEYGNGDWYAVTVMPHSAPQTAADANQSGELSDLMQGLLSTNPMVFRTTARRAYSAAFFDEPLLEVAAWRLYSDMKTEDDALVEGLAYICKLLGNSGNSRYYALLSQVKENAGHRKLRKYAQSALLNIPFGDGEQFTGESVSTQ
jgi:hypothetical protein